MHVNSKFRIGSFEKMVESSTELDTTSILKSLQASFMKKDKRTSTLVSYGDSSGYSAMARTVGLPAAIGVELILNHTITRRGVVVTMSRDIYEPILYSLERENVKFTEKICVDG
ncbi:hypothetical protein SeMB42_g01371 [Synchytrium endobioticum]|uniref:Saccharopine dehydrogenase-like C-terminal domain-containing protein n=1 Tax=Synchytrium endobioticum TaxID=286115 RepID=A0A507CQY3_9FUNG|nr:hypothetical protein SeLEV6574_g06031 [Synchytrium endobioticum]TPX52532.1 hypothetical protein SeMB42_g01371 [Synchytrium endobioticum]